MLEAVGDWRLRGHVLVVACLPDQVQVARVKDFWLVVGKEVCRVASKISLEGILLAIHQFDEVALRLFVKYRLAMRWHSQMRRIVAQGIGGVFQNLYLVLNEFLDLLLLIFQPYLVLYFRIKVIIMLLLCNLEILKQIHIVFEKRSGLDFLQVNIFLHLRIILTITF